MMHDPEGVCTAGAIPCPVQPNSSQHMWRPVCACLAAAPDASHVLMMWDVGGFRE
jgi:hypothetical protein